MEVKRQLDVLDRHLATNAFMAGAAYTIADMAIWPWYGGPIKGVLYESAEFLSVHEYRHVGLLDRADCRAPRREARPHR